MRTRRKANPMRNQAKGGSAVSPDLKCVHYPILGAMRKRGKSDVRKSPGSKMAISKPLDRF